MDNTNNELNKHEIEQVETEVVAEEIMEEIEDTAEENAKEIEDRVAERGRKSAIIFFGVLGIAIVSFIIAVVAAVTMSGPDKSVQRDYHGNLVEMSTYSDFLTYYPKHITVDLGDYNAELDIDVSDSIVMATDIYDQYAYVVYMAEDASTYTEIIIAKDIPGAMVIDEYTAANLHKQKDEIFASTELNEETGIITGRAFTSLEGRGMLAVIQQSKTADDNIAEKLATTIKECTLYSKNTKNTDEKFFLEIDGLGVYDMNELSFLDESAGIYFGQDTVCRFYNTKDNVDYAWLTYADNQYMMNNTFNMEQAEGWNNLYYDKDFDDETRMGHRGMGIQTSKGYYYIKVAENAPEGTEDEIIKWLGIQPDDEKVPFIGDRGVNVVPDVTIAEESTKQAE